VSPFQDYIYHLTQVHGVRRYELTNPEGLYDFGYDATGEDVLGFHDVVCKCIRIAIASDPYCDTDINGLI